MRYINLF